MLDSNHVAFARREQEVGYNISARCELRLHDEKLHGWLQGSLNLLAFLRYSQSISPVVSRVSQGRVTHNADRLTHFFHSLTKKPSCRAQRKYAHKSCGCGECRVR